MVSWGENYRTAMNGGYIEKFCVFYVLGIMMEEKPLHGYVERVYIEEFCVFMCQALSWGEKHRTAMKFGEKLAIRIILFALVLKTTRQVRCRP